MAPLGDFKAADCRVLRTRLSVRTKSAWETHTSKQRRRHGARPFYRSGGALGKNGEGPFPLLDNRIVSVAEKIDMRLSALDDRSFAPRDTTRHTTDERLEAHASTQTIAEELYRSKTNPGISRSELSLGSGR